MFYFPWGAVINGAVKCSTEQKLQLKLKGNTNASLYFTGTEFQSVLSVEKMLTLLYGYIYIYISERCQAFIQFLLIIAAITYLRNAVFLDT